MHDAVEGQPLYSPNISKYWVLKRKKYANINIIKNDNSHLTNTLTHSSNEHSSNEYSSTKDSPTKNSQTNNLTNEQSPKENIKNKN